MWGDVCMSMPWRSALLLCNVNLAEKLDTRLPKAALVRIVYDRAAAET